MAGILMATGNFPLSFSMAGIIMGIPGLMYYYFFARIEDRHRALAA